MLLAILPLAFVDIAISVKKFALSVGLIVLPLAFVSTAAAASVSRGIYGVASTVLAAVSMVMATVLDMAVLAALMPLVTP